MKKLSLSITIMVVITLSILLSCKKEPVSDPTPEPTTASGQALFWVNSDLGCGNINVTCNGVTRTIDTYYGSGAPACGANGCATFTLAPGTYSFSGKCSGKTWNGNVTVVLNDCSKIQLIN